MKLNGMIGKADYLKYKVICFLITKLKRWIGQISKPQNDIQLNLLLQKRILLGKKARFSPYSKTFITTLVLCGFSVRRELEKPQRFMPFKESLKNQMNLLL